MLEGEAQTLTRAAIAKALDGDTTALRLCLDRIAPPRKGRTLTLALPTISDLAGLATAQAELLAAMSRGEITTEEATDAAKVLELVGSAIERRDLEDRIAALEAARRS
jgi:hypothetical protein